MYACKQETIPRRYQGLAGRTRAVVTPGSGDLPVQWSRRGHCPTAPSSGFFLPLGALSLPRFTSLDSPVFAALTGLPPSQRLPSPASSSSTHPLSASSATGRLVRRARTGNREWRLSLRKESTQDDKDKDPTPEDDDARSSATGCRSTSPPRILTANVTRHKEHMKCRISNTRNCHKLLIAASRFRRHLLCRIDQVLVSIRCTSFAIDDWRSF